MHGSNKCIDILKEVNQVITSRFQKRIKKRLIKRVAELTAKSKRARFHSYVNECVEQFTTYALFDKVSNFDYYFGEDNEKLKNEKTRTRIIFVMVCERLVTITSAHQSSCLIHYICTYPSLQGRGYTKQIMKVVLIRMK